MMWESIMCEVCTWNQLCVINGTMMADDYNYMMRTMAEESNHV